MVARVLLPFLLVGGLIAGISLAYAATRPLVAAFAESETVLQKARSVHSTIYVRGTVLDTSADGYVTLETKDPFGRGEIVTLYGLAAKPAETASMRPGDYVNAAVRRTPGAIVFESMTIIHPGQQTVL